ncbi:hypothetical protein DUI87_10661 [Hirundo rustica rustica]|uniref:Uncharacterized protein n=1 Tax=Hirundo rustica rustica TaxID=333673 RepID=A0A3M0KQI0_HIRRU|nr:hypothetical protein DUI87_10661 [Hirundo rustica rustica]
MCVTDTDVKQCWSQYRALRTPLVTGLPLDTEPLTATLSVVFQPSPYPPSGPSVKSVSLQFRDTDVVWNSVKYFAQVKESGFQALLEEDKNSKEAFSHCSLQIDLPKEAVGAPTLPVLQARLDKALSNLVWMVFKDTYSPLTFYDSMPSC